MIVFYYPKSVAWFWWSKVTTKRWRWTYFEEKKML